MAQMSFWAGAGDGHGAQPGGHAVGRRRPPADPGRAGGAAGGASNLCTRSALDAPTRCARQASALAKKIREARGGRGTRVKLKAAAAFAAAPGRGCFDTLRRRSRGKPCQTTSPRDLSAGVKGDSGSMAQAELVLPTMFRRRLLSYSPPPDIFDDLDHVRDARH